MTDKPVKLSKPQRDALEQAEYKLRNDRRLAASGRTIEDGWFMPQHHECAAVSIRKQTCSSLCGLGLFEWRRYGERWDKRRAKYVLENEYRITEAGIELHKRLMAEKEAE